MMDTPRIAAIIVTHNRRTLLRECLQAVASQSLPLAKVVLIDNHCTDGTPTALHEQGILPQIPESQAEGVQSLQGALPATGRTEPVPFHYYRLPTNCGGAGGFNEGIRRSVPGDVDFLWLMDDDTIAEPDALLQLHRAWALLATHGHAPGFVCSKVLFKPGEVHRMNLPQLQPVIGGLPFNTYETEGVLLVKSASFVSLLVPVAVVRACGLPFRNFFIWYDDLEYTTRIGRAGFPGAYAPHSRVFHRTASNYYVDIALDRPENLGKYRWGIRNQLVCLRRENPWLFCCTIPYHLTVLNWRVLRRRRSHRLRGVWIQTIATLSSLFFIPRE
ncbi:MAG: glycosyltransferase [Acidobacteria bacterium]|nr:glycosyltransferase [Acidobacteriota bacterium]